MRSPQIGKGVASARAFAVAGILLVALGVGVPAMSVGAASYGYSVTATIAVGPGAEAVTVDPTTDTIYVATYGGPDNTVSVINGSSDAVTATVPVGYDACAIAVDTAFDTVYVANAGSYGGSNGTVSVINGTNDTVTATIPDPASPRSIAVDPNTNTIYVANYNGTVSVIHGGAVTGTINVGYGTLNGVAVDPATGTIYVTHYPDGVVSVISGTTDTVTSSIDLAHGFSPVAVAVDPSTDTVYVASYPDDTLSVIDGSTDSVTSTVNLGAEPLSLAVDPTTNTIYVAQYSSNGSSVSVLDGSTDTATATVPIGGRGGGVAVDYATHFVYATGGQAVSVIEQTPQGPPATTTTVGTSTNPATYGQPVTLTATVSPSDGSGTVSFFAGGSPDPITGCAQLVLGSSGGAYQATCSTSTMSAGTQPVTAAYSGDADFQASSGSLSGGEVIDPAPLSVTAPSPTTTYGSALPALVPSYAGFVNGDGPASLSAKATCTTSATKSSPVGHYPVTCSGASDPNYTISYVAGTSSVDPAPLSVTAPSPTTTYGSPIPALSPTYSGFVDGDTPASLSSKATCATSATASSPVGTYPVTCSEARDRNYTVSYVSGTLTTTKALLTVTPNDATRPYGSSNPAFAVSYSGFVLEQDLASSAVSGSPSCSSPANASSPPGTYPITCLTGTLAAKNYSFTFVAGTLTVAKAPTTISATPALLSLSPFGADLLTLHATLTSEVTKAGLSGQRVVFSAGSTVLCRAVTNSSGSATCDALSDPAEVPVVLAADGYQVTYSGSTDYLPSSTSAPLVGE